MELIWLVLKVTLKGMSLFILLRADIDYATAEADTTYGKLGVKVWICKGEILPEKKKGDK